MKFFEEYSKEAQKKFLELMCNNEDFETALEKSGLPQSCIEDWAYKKRKVVDSDLEKAWEDCRSELTVEDFKISICWVEAACYDYDIFAQMDFLVEKVDAKKKEE